MSTEYSWSFQQELRYKNQISKIQLQASLQLGDSIWLAADITNLFQGFMRLSSGHELLRSSIRVYVRRMPRRLFEVEEPVKYVYGLDFIKLG